jgi:CubicO group peptidase (beta-lactamase class C family)
MASGLTKAGLGRLGAVVAEAVGEDKIPGLAVLVARGDQVQVEAQGTLAIGGSPVTRDSLFRIASTTKPITAATTLALAGEGLIDLDEPVDRLVPELANRQVLRRPDGDLDDTVPADRPVTARDLLTFTFGFGATMEMFMAAEPWPVVAAANELSLATLGPPEPSVQPDPETWIARFGSLPLLAQPGERWMYNTGAQVLGVLLARAAGQPLADVMRTRVFEPLGMKDTAFWAGDTDRLATLYRQTPDGLVLFDEPDGMWGRPQAFADGAAGLVSTVGDLLAFARMLLSGGGPVLTPEAAKAMTTGQLTGAQKAQGGFGPDFFAHQSWSFGQMVQDSGVFGWDGGLGSTWQVDPRYDLTIIVLTQRMFMSPERPPEHVAIVDAAYEALG